MKKIAIVLLIIITSLYGQDATAQASSKLFKYHGYNVQYSSVPYEFTSFLGPLDGNAITFIGFGYSFNLRYSLAELSDDASIGLTGGILAALDFGISLDDVIDAAYGGVYFPVHVNYNFGAGATYDTDKDFGVGIGIGLTPSYMPLSGGGDLSKFRLSPSAQISMRYWGAKTNALSEYFVRFDKLPGLSEAVATDEDPFGFTLAAGIRRYIGY